MSPLTDRYIGECLEKKRQASKFGKRTRVATVSAPHEPSLSECRHPPRWDPFLKKSLNT